MTKLASLIAGFVATSAVFAGAVGAQRRPAPTVQAPRRLSVEDLSRTVVRIEVFSGGSRGGGSGVVLESNGVVATAAHVLRGADSAFATVRSGERLTVRGVLDLDERLDLALIRIEAVGLTQAVQGNSDSLQLGQRLIAIGSPLGLENSVTDGILSSLRLSEGIRYIQTSTPVSPGSSGGPVFDSTGALVGIIVSGIRGGGAENLNFALPVNYIRAKLELARNNTPTPVESVAEASGEEVQREESVEFGAIPDSVNGGYGFDIDVLDGVEMRTEHDIGSGRVRSWVRYGVTTNLQGERRLERLERRTYRLSGGLTERWSGGDDISVRLGVSPKWSWEIRGPGSSSGGGSSNEIRRIGGGGGQDRWTADGGEFIRTRAGRIGRGRVPRGLIPGIGAGWGLSIIRDSLPARGTIWTFDYTSSQILDVRFELVGSEVVRIPVVSSDESCESTAPGRSVRVLTRKGFLIVGATRVPVRVMVQTPHLVLPERIQCVRFPIDFQALEQAQ